MGKSTLLETIKDWISSIGWKMFIWGINMTEDEYFNSIFKQEYDRRFKDKKPPTGSS